MVSGECAVKVNEILEAWITKNGRPLFGRPKPSQPPIDYEAIYRAGANLPSMSQSKDAEKKQKVGKLLSNIKVHNRDPLILKFSKGNLIARQPDGSWTFFPGNKKADPATTAVANQWLTQNAMPLPPVQVKDRRGQLWTYNDNNRTWTGPTGQPVTDPGSIQKLNRAAQLQFQNREMQTHTIPGTVK